MIVLRIPVLCGPVDSRAHHDVSITPVGAGVHDDVILDRSIIQDGALILGRAGRNLGVHGKRIRALETISAEPVFAVWRSRIEAHARQMKPPAIKGAATSRVAPNHVVARIRARVFAEAVDGVGNCTRPPAHPPFPRRRRETECDGGEGTMDASARIRGADGRRRSRAESDDGDVEFFKSVALSFRARLKRLPRFLQPRGPSPRDADVVVGRVVGVVDTAAVCRSAKEKGRIYGQEKAGAEDKVTEGIAFGGVRVSVSNGLLDSSCEPAEAGGADGAAHAGRAVQAPHVDEKAMQSDLKKNGGGGSEKWGVGRGGELLSRIYNERKHV